MIKKLIFPLIVISLFFIYLVFIFYDELFRKGAFVVKFNTKFLRRFNFIKKRMIAYNLPTIINIDFYNVAGKFFRSLRIFNFNLNFNINIRFNFFKRPGTRLYLLIFNFLYNFIVCFFIICLNWAFKFYAEASKYSLAHPYDKELLNILAIKSTFYFFMLLLLELLFLLIVVYFAWKKFEYAVLIPFNLFILFYIFFCFLFYFFCKSFTCIIIYLYTRKSWVYYFKANFINFYNNLWSHIRFIIWYKSSIIIKILICIYIFISFNLLSILVYMHIYKFLFF